MSEEFTTLVKKLKIPLLSDANLAALRQLQDEWDHWHEREQQIMPLRIEEERKLAYATFVENPTPENEHRLTILADVNLTGVRYALLRRAFTDVRARITAQAGKLLSPVFERISAKLAAEHERRIEKAEPIMSSKNRNPVVIESRKAIEYADRLSGYVFTACGGNAADRSPLELAGPLVSKASVLTPEGQA
jgi:hypothetical protein